jgi:hypothetical protein
VNPENYFEVRVIQELVIEISIFFANFSIEEIWLINIYSDPGVFTALLPAAGIFR